MTRVSFLITFSGDTISFNREVSIKEENILNKRYNKHLILTLLEERKRERDRTTNGTDNIRGHL